MGALGERQPEATANNSGMTIDTKSPPLVHETSGADPTSDSSSPPSSPSLMAFVIGILGLALVLLVVTDMIIAIRGNTLPPDLNTITSLIAGGFVGFLTPHVASQIRRRPTLR